MSYSGGAMLKYMRRYGETRTFIVLCLLSVLIGAIPSLFIQLESIIIDTALHGVSSIADPLFLRPLGLYLALLLIVQLCAHVSSRMQQSRKARAGARFETDRMEKANRIVFSITEGGDFHRLLDESAQVTQIDGESWQAIQNALTGVSRVLCSFVVLWFMSPVSAVVILVMIAACTALNVYAARAAGDIWRQYISNMRYPNYLAQLLLGREYAAERKIFHYLPEISERYQKTYDDALDKNILLGKKRFRAELAVTLATAVYSVAVILLLAIPLTRGQTSLGVFAAAFTAAVSLRNTGGQVYDAMTQYAGNRVKYAGYQAFMALEETKKQEDVAISLPFSVAFDHVAFTYPGAKKPALRDVSFSIESGQHLALVGENGCGKSTLVKLLCGLYTPDSGRITINGIPVDGLSEECRQRLFAVMAQDFYHYPLTVRENIGLHSQARPKDEEIIPLLIRLGMKEEEIPGLLRGNLLKGQADSLDLSGGQWQKIVAAGMLLSSSPFVIMDEPNAAMDPQSEMDFFRLCRERLKDKTTLIISHRLGAVKDVENILVLKDGELVGLGSHSQLMETCDHYRALYETQRGLYEKAQ